MCASVEDAVFVLNIHFVLIHHDEGGSYKSKMILVDLGFAQIFWLSVLTYKSGFFQTKSGFIPKLGHPWKKEKPKPEIPLEDH